MIRRGLGSIKPAGFDKVIVTSKAMGKRDSWSEQWELVHGDVEAKSPQVNNTKPPQPVVKTLVSSKKRVQWYQKTWLVVTMLVLFPWAGVPLTWLTQWSKPAKIVSSALGSLWILILLLNGGTDVETVSEPVPVDPPQETVQASLSDCEKAMEAAAAVSSMQDKLEDVNPAIRSCGSMNEFVAASSKFPEALDGADEETFVSYRCEDDSSLKSTPICSSLLPTLTTIHYLAVNPGTPTPEDPVPVSDQETIRMIVAAAESQDQKKFNSIATSSSVLLIPGGRMVDIVATSGDLVQVKLGGRDAAGNDLSGQVRWTHSKFIQTRQMKL